MTPDDKFDFTKYFQPIIDEFAIVGREVEIKKKDKKSFGKVESAFLKDNTDVYDVSFQTDKSIKSKLSMSATMYLLILLISQSASISSTMKRSGGRHSWLN